MKKKIRIYYPWFPYPASEGSYHVVLQQALALEKLGFAVELVFWKTDGSEKKDFIPGSEIRLRRLDTSPPETTEKRGLRVARSLVSPLSSAELYHYSPDVWQTSEASRLLESEEVDLAIYHFSFAYSWMKQVKLPREKKRMIYFHNLESELFKQRAQASRHPLLKTVSLLNYFKLRRHENELVRAAVLREHEICEIWVISLNDADLLRARVSEKAGLRLRLVPPAVSEEDSLRRRDAFLKRVPKNPDKKILGFLGKLDFGPNLESAVWILERLCPILAQKGFAGELWIAGKNAPSSLQMRARAFPFVKMLGFVPDLGDFWDSLSYFLAPHLNGSGSRIKMLESVSFGVPTLTTSSAKNVLSPQLFEGGFLLSFDSPEAWAEKIMGEAPLVERAKLAQAPSHHLEELSGRRIYSFLADFL